MKIGLSRIVEVNVFLFPLSTVPVGWKRIFFEIALDSMIFVKFDLVNWLITVHFQQKHYFLEEFLLIQTNTASMSQKTLESNPRI
jgi:hypothetical protein